MKKMIKRAAAAALSLCMLGGALSFDAPAFRKCSITANAYTNYKSFDYYDYPDGTGKIVLKNNVELERLTDFEYRGDVTEIYSSKGTVLPENCAGMFNGYNNCTNIDLSNADTSKVTNMSKMFANCTSLETIDLSGFDTGKVTNMSNMFFNCSEIYALDLSGFDTSNVTNMCNMFKKCSSLYYLYLNDSGLTSFDTSSVTDMSGMFSGCSSLFNTEMKRFDTSNVTNMALMFYGCSQLYELDLSGYDTSKVTSMAEMFNGCSNLVHLDVSSFDTSRVTDMSSMFCNCYRLDNYLVHKFDVSGFDTSKVTDFSSMFRNCTSLHTLDLRNFNTSQAVDMTSMFSGCLAIYMNLSGFDMSKVEGYMDMFSGCNDMRCFAVGDKFGNITDDHQLPNKNGWANAKNLNLVVSGTGECAEIKNTGNNTYYRYDTPPFRITEQPPEIVYYDSYRTAHITLKAEGTGLKYEWYYKTPHDTQFILDDYFTGEEWTGSYDFYGYAYETGLTSWYDGTEMYCVISNEAGAKLTSNHFTLKMYKEDVDRNITVRLPKVGETYAEYMADKSSIVPAELIFDKERFWIDEADANGRFVLQPNGLYPIEDDNYVFKAGRRYVFVFNMHLPEYVSPSVIYQFYSKGLIVNGKETGSSDGVDEGDLYFTVVWTSPVLEGGLLKGDVNADHAFNVADVLLMQKWLLDLPDIQLIDWKAGDICPDNRLDAFDLCQMRRMLVKG